MSKIKAIVDDAVRKIEPALGDEQKKTVEKIIEDAVIRGIIEGQHQALNVCMNCDEAEQDLAHKIAAAIRQKNDALIANLSSLR